METLQLVQYEELARITDLVMLDRTAVEKWSNIIRSLISSPTQRFSLPGADEDGGRKRVQASLEMWHKNGQMPGLLDVLRQHGLDALARKIGTQTFEPPKLESLSVNSTGGRVRESRDAVLGKLHQMMTSKSGPKLNVYSIVGPAGVGKTTMARKYSLDRKAEYDENVYWINADTLPALNASFTSLASYLRVLDTRNLSGAEIAAKVYAAIQSKNGNQKCLFVFDGVQKKEDLSLYLPDPKIHAKFWVLMTSRKRDQISGTGNQLELSVLSLDDAVQLVRTRLEQLPREQAVKLADKLQCHPIAIQMATAFIVDRSCHQDFPYSIEWYLLEFYNSQTGYVSYILPKYNECLPSDGDEGDGNEFMQTIYTVYYLIFHQAALSMVMDMPLRKLIYTLAHLCPSIGHGFLANTFGPSSSLVELDLKKLEKLAILQRDETTGNISIHPMVQHAVRLGMKAEERAETLETMAQRLHKAFTPHAGQGFWTEACNNALHLFQFQRDRPEIMEKKHDYFLDLYSRLVTDGRADDALGFLQECTTVYETLVGRDHEDTLIMKYHMSSALSALRRPKEVMDLFIEILPICQKMLGNGHWLTLYVFQDSGMFLHKAGMNKEALEILDFTISMRDEAHKPLSKEDMADIRRVKLKKAAILSRHNAAEAIKLLQGIYEEVRASFGDDHLQTLAARGRFASAICQYGDTEQGLAMLKTCVDRYTQVAGIKNAGTVLMKQNMDKVEKAIQTNSKVSLRIFPDEPFPWVMDADVVAKTKTFAAFLKSRIC